MKQSFKEWLEKLKEIWETKNPSEIIDICADKFLWYETPFHEPLTTKAQLLKEWQSILNQEDINFTYNVVSTDENEGVAHWHVTFTRLSSKERVELDGIFQILLDEQGKCIEFHQWYNSKV